MQLVDHDVVAFPPVHGADDDVFGAARGVEEREFVFVGAEKVAELRARAVQGDPPAAPVALEHLLVRVGAQGIADRDGERAGRGRIEVRQLLGDGEGGADAEGIVGIDL